MSKDFSYLSRRILTGKAGRDAAALNRLGHHVVAVEPAAALALIGKAHAPEVEWVADRLPKLSSVRAKGEFFDFILCSAVLMSISPAHIGPSFASMAGLLKQHGKLAVTVREATLDENTFLHTYSDNEIIAAARKAGLRCAKQTASSDALGRGMVWRSYVFTRV